MESNKDEGAIDVLSSIIDECVSNPAKQQQFVDEGCIELLLELCRSQNLQVKSYAAGALVMLCHQNNTAKAKVIAQGGATTLVLICQPHERKSSNLGDPTNNERLLSHMQGAAVVQKLAYKNAACQRELISAGAVRQLVALCDVFDADGSHGNCCQMIYKHSDEADKAMYEMTKGRQLIGSVKELGKSQAVRAALHLLHKGLDFTVLSELFNKFNSVDLYDTSMPGKNVIIAKELVEKGLVWPDLSREDPPCERSRGKNDKSKGENTWRDISICEVIDAGHFWAHVGGESTKLRIEEIRKFLHSQICDPLQGIPEPGDIVGVSGNIAGHKDHYRAIILDVSSATDAQDGQAKVFAIDYGFTVLVKTSSLFTLPKELQECLPQVSLCTLAGVQPCPTHAAILEHTAGALQNLSYELANVGFITTAGGIEVLLKMLSIPVRDILIQALGALLNISLDFRYRARIGFLGGIQDLLDICQKYADDNKILELSLGLLKTITADTIINRLRMVNADGLPVLIHLYHYCTSEPIRNSILEALRNLIGDAPGAPKSDPGPQRSRPVLDIRHVMDDPVPQARFSVSMPADDGYRPPRRRERRRRSRRADQIVGPKPVHVSLSLENLRKGYTDSGSDSDEDYGGRWTSETEGDTDGEPLLKDAAELGSRELQLFDSKSEKFYVQTHHVPFAEDDTHDFRSQTNVHDVSKRPLARTLCAFLNNKKCGTAYIGLHKDGVVAGVRVKRKERDLLRLGLDELMGRFKPSIKHDMYKVEFVPIVRPKGAESAITRQVVEDRFIIEVSITKCTGLVYSTPDGKCYFRHKSANIEMNTQEIREKTIREQEDMYNSEINQLQRLVKDMRKQLNGKTVSEKPDSDSDEKSNTKQQKTPAISPTTPHSGNTTSATDACVIC